MIAVTGAAGFIGSNLAQKMEVLGNEILVVDHPLTPEKMTNLAGMTNYRTLAHDQFLLDLEAGREHPEVIYHLGACSATTETNWDYLYENNVVYSQRLWTWCARERVPFVYASSAATYGDGSLGFDDHLHPDQLTPLNLYGKSKNDFDRWALAEAARGAPTPPRWAGLKFFNVYGPRETHKGRMASVAWQTYLQIKATGAMKLFRSTDPAYPDGGQLRDFVYVLDCVNHMIWMAINDHPGGLYNSGTGQARSFHDLAKTVFQALHLEPKIEFIDMPADLARQYQNFTQARMDKLKGVGCDFMVTPIEKGVRTYISWLEMGSKWVS